MPDEDAHFAYPRELAKSATDYDDKAAQIDEQRQWWLDLMDPTYLKAVFGDDHAAKQFLKVYNESMIKSRDGLELWATGMRALGQQNRTVSKVLENTDDGNKDISEGLARYLGGSELTPQTPFADAVGGGNASPSPSPSPSASGGDQTPPSSGNTRR